MTNAIDLRDLVQAVINVAESRFEIDYKIFQDVPLLVDGQESAESGRDSHEDDQLTLLIEFTPDEVNERAVVRLRRKCSQGAGWRTFLVATIEDEQELAGVMQWAAQSRSQLLEPETSDLYLLLGISDVSQDTCTRIEASEQFCRKYVLRPGESPVDLITRSSLFDINQGKTGHTLTDPLSGALASAAEDFEWLDELMQTKWREHFLSGQNGISLVELLFAKPVKDEN